MAQDKFRQFLNGFVAASELLRIAAEKHCFIEYICVAAAVIDADLRIGLIFRHQLKTQSDEVLDELLYQADEDKIINERKIYKWALDQKVIDGKTFEKLEKLYARRNQVIHRYIISDITTMEVLEIASQFEQMIPAINGIICDLERQQEILGIGMKGSGTLGAALSKLSEMSAEKHADKNLELLLQRGKT